MGDNDVATRNAEAIEKAEEIQRSTTRKAALKHAPKAIEMMAKISRGVQLPGRQRPTPNTILNACQSVLHQAHGRPETRDARTGQVDAGLTVIVNQLSTGEQRRVAGGDDARLVGSIESALAVASKLQSEKKRG